APLYVALMDVVPVMVQCVIRVFEADDQGMLRKVVEEGGRRFEKQRQIVFDAARRDAVADVLINSAAAHVAVEGGPVAVPESGNRFFVQREFPGGQQPDFPDGFYRE